jgi:2-methylisocitrate lyase-like PEP mutase family enzyme
VAHVSVGSGPYQACLALLEEIAQSLFRDGSFAPMLKRQLTYAEVQKLVGGQTA